MTKPTSDISNYRACVGVVIFNSKGQVFLGRRRGTKGFWVWQFPQGGMDKGETVLEAAYRELYEETGITEKHVELLGQTEDWLYYDLPDERAKRMKWYGQKQKWVAFRFTGKKKHINLFVETPSEFSRYAWGNLKDTKHLIVPFKRKVYKDVAKQFKRFAKPMK